MRRMLSGLLATAMVASVCATVSSAAVTTQSTPANITLTFVAEAAAIAVDPQIELLLDDGGKIILTADADDFTGAMTANQVAEAFSQATIAVEGRAMFANGTAMRAEDFKLMRNGPNVRLETKIDGRDAAFTYTAGAGNVIVRAGLAAAPADAFNQAADGVGSDADLTMDNIPTDIRNIIVCDANGEPIPLTESPDGVDKDQNSTDGVQSGQTVYFMIRNDMEWKFHDDTYWKMKLSKGDNGKYIKAISDVTKNFGSDLYSVYTHTRVPGSGASRARYVKVEMSDIFTDDEFKVTLDLRLTPMSKAEDVFGVDDDAELKIEDFSFYVKNIVKSADGDWEVGVGGLMLDPLENDWNEVTYYDEDGDLAFMKFFGDSDIDKFYAKLSTKWEHADYASYFNDQDAYIFQFTGSPSLSSTSRADLQIYNPFVDEDGNETFDPEQAVIYQVVDGDLFDITDSFTYEEGDNGDMAYCTRTRFLGTYIVCQKPVEEASSDDIIDLVPDDNLTPDDNAGAPVEVNPGNNNGGNGGKAPANTGKF